MKIMNTIKRSRLSILKLWIFFILFLSTAYAQNGITFKKFYNEPRLDSPRDFVICSNEDYLIVGTSTSFSQGDSDIHVMRIDKYGTLLWKKAFGGYNSELAYSIDQTDDGNFIIAGFTSSFGAGGYDMYVLKINGNGTAIWAKTYGGTGTDYAREIKRTSDGGFIITGYSNSTSSSFDAFLMKLDANGNQQWIKNYGGMSDESSFSVKQTSDDGFVLFGNTFSNGTGGADFFLVRTDAIGNKLWEKTFGEPGFDEGQYVLLTADGGFIITGDCENLNAGDYDITVRKLDGSGNMVWSKTFGGGAKDVGKMIQPTKDGGYIAVGHSSSIPSVGLDVYVVKMNEQGKVLTAVTEANTFKNNLLIYPNPAVDKIALKFKQGNNSRYRIQLVNTMGQVVFSEEVTISQSSNEVSLNLQSYPKGIYLVELNNQDDYSRITRKIVLE